MINDLIPYIYWLTKKETNEIRNFKKRFNSNLEKKRSYKKSRSKDKKKSIQLNVSQEKYEPFVKYGQDFYPFRNTETKS